MTFLREVCVCVCVSAAEKKSTTTSAHSGTRTLHAEPVPVNSLLLIKSPLQLFKTTATQLPDTRRNSYACGARRRPTCRILNFQRVHSLKAIDALARRQRAPSATLALSTWHGLRPTQLAPPLTYCSIIYNDPLNLERRCFLLSSVRASARSAVLGCQQLLNKYILKPRAL